MSLLLDPATKSYYDAGLLAGTAACDLILFAGPVPWLSLTAVCFLYLPSSGLTAHPHADGLLRTAYLIITAAFVCVARTPRGRSPLHKAVRQVTIRTRS